MPPLVERSGQYSQHVCREKLRPIPPEQVSVKAPPDSGEGE